MTHPRPALRATAFCAALAGLPAAADITPEGLWQAWQDRAAAAGHALSATVDQGGTLGLDGLTVTRPLGTGTITARFDRLDLVQDGADVRAILPAGGIVTVTAMPGADDPLGETRQAVLALGDRPLGAVASGDAAAPLWTVDADAATVTLVSLTEGGTPVPADARIDLAGLSGTLSGLDGGGPLAADLRADRLASDIEATDPATGDTIRSTATQSDTELRARLTEDPADPTAWRLHGTLTGGASEAVSLRSGPTGTFESDSRQDSATLDLTMTAARTDYAAQVAGIATTLSGTLLPQGPLGLAIGTAGLSMSLPTGLAAGLQTATVALDLGGVVPGDRLWALIDPMGALPREPGTVTLRAEADLASPEPGATAPGGPDLPGLLPRALRIPEIAVGLGGAQLAGDGAFDIPAGPMGVPDIAAATGAMDLRATGVNGLLQQAIGAGAMTMEQAMGAQMMLGMFATQGVGDSFTTRIELLPDGGLVVNGTQLR
jgi:hypothetical protein